MDAAYVRKMVDDVKTVLDNRYNLANLNYKFDKITNLSRDGRNITFDMYYSNPNCTKQFAVSLHSETW
jgi:hypothetical protein